VLLRQVTVYGRADGFPPGVQNGFFIPRASFRARGFLICRLSLKKSLEILRVRRFEEGGIPSHAVFPFRKGRPSFLSLPFIWSLLG